MKKRFVSIFLVLTVLMSLVVVPAYATYDDTETFVDAFIIKVYGLENKDQFIDFMMLIKEIGDKEAFANAYAEAFAVLDGSQQDRLTEELGITTGLITDLVTEVQGDIFTRESLSYYLSEDTPTMRAEFKTQLLEREEDISDILGSDDNDISEENLTAGFDKMDNAFDLVGMMADTANANMLRVCNAYSFQHLYYQSLVAETFIATANAAGIASIQNIPTAVEALNKFVDFYNTSLEDSDQQLVYEYLYDNGFVRVLSSGGGNNDDDDDDDTPAPVTPVTPPANETVDELTKDLEQKETEEVIEAIDSALDAINDSLEQGGTLDQVEELSTKLIVQLGEITEEENKEELVELITDIAENAIEQAGRTEAETADLTEFDFSTVSSAVNDMNETMQESLEAQDIESDKEIEVTVTVTVPVVSETEVEVELPPLSEVFNEENNLDSVKLESEVASFELSAGTFGEDEQVAVKIGAKVVDVTEVPEVQKAKVPQGAKVVDLNAYVGETKKTSFEKPIKVTVAYDLKEGESADNVSVFLLRDDGTVEEVGGVYNEATGTITFLRDSFSLYFVSEATATFTDIDNYPEAKNAIEVMAGKGVIKGRGNGIFDPGAEITRAEFACMVARLLKVKGDASQLPFNDVPTNAWYLNDMAAAYQNGIVNGMSANMFAPKSSITRQEAAAMVANALAYLGYKYEANSDDISTVYSDYSAISDWAKNAVATLHREELVQDVFSGEFMAKTNITRAETAMLLYNLYFK